MKLPTRGRILNGISPAYDSVFSDVLLTLFYLGMTISIECGLFYFYFRNKPAQAIGDYLFVMFLLNMATFVIGFILFLVKITFWWSY